MIAVSQELILCRRYIDDMNGMILVPGYIFLALFILPWSWIFIVSLSDGCILYTDLLLYMKVSRFWACPCPKTTFGQVPVRWQCTFAWCLPVTKNWVVKYSPIASSRTTAEFDNLFYVINLKNHVLRSEQLLSPASKGFRPSQSKLSQAHSTPQTPGFVWDRVKTSGLHHNIPLLSDNHNIISI